MCALPQALSGAFDEGLVEAFLLRGQAGGKDLFEALGELEIPASPDGIPDLP